MIATLVEKKRQAPRIAELLRKECHALQDKHEESVGLRILLVDDSETAPSLALQLRMHGHQVQIAPTHLVAVEREDADQPDVVVMDLAATGSDSREMAQRYHNQMAAKRPFLIGMNGPGAAVKYRSTDEPAMHLNLAKPVDVIFLVKVLRRLQTIVKPASAGQWP
jgi:CheY-like chemotaxis protein